MFQTIKDREEISKGLDKHEPGLLVSDTELQNGIWPRSKILWMAIFYMALFIIRPWEQLFPVMAIVHPERVFAICMLVAVFLSGGKKFQLTWQTVTVLLFFTAIVFSGFFAYDPSLAKDEVYKFLSIVIFYFVFLIVIHSPYGLAFIVLSYVFTMCVYLSKSQWEFFVNGKHEYRMGVSRLIGIEDTFGGPNALAMSVVVSLPFAALLWKNRTLISNTWPVFWQKKLRFGLLIYGALAVTSIILTNSRSGMAGFVVFVTIIGLSSKGFGKKIKFSIVGVIILAVLWTLMPDENKGRFRTIWAPEEGPANAQESAEGRVAGYKAGMEMFRRFPFTGVGVGNFVAYRVPNIDGEPLQAHNLAGQLLGETGWLGGVTFLMVLGSTIVNCRKIIKYARYRSDPVTSFLADLAKACLISLTLLIFLGMFGHNLYRFNWLWIAAFSSLALRFIHERIITIEMRDYI